MPGSATVALINSNRRLSEERATHESTALNALSVETQVESNTQATTLKDAQQQYASAGEYDTPAYAIDPASFGLPVTEAYLEAIPTSNADPAAEPMSAAALTGVIITILLAALASTIIRRHR